MTHYLKYILEDKLKKYQKKALCTDVEKMKVQTNMIDNDNLELPFLLDNGEEMNLC